MPIKTTRNYTKYYDDDEKLHREDGPAVSYSNGNESWWIHGRRHRVNGPARTANGITEWFFMSKMHREDGPAYQSPTEEIWYFQGKKHRLDGPAHIEHRSNGTTIEKWFRNGKSHRIDGPAVIVKNNDVIQTEEWFLNGLRHRVDGPGFRNYITGEIYYYINNTPYSDIATHRRDCIRFKLLKINLFEEDVLRE